MTSPLLAIAPQTQNPNNNAQAATQQNFATGIAGQNSFLALLLGQIGENPSGGSFDLNRFSLNTPSHNAGNGQAQAAFNLDTVLAEQLNSLNAALGLQGNVPLANQQTQLQDYGLRIREYLASLIENTQGAGTNPNLSATPQAASQIQPLASDIVIPQNTQGAANPASSIANAGKEVGESITNRPVASAQNPGIPTALANLLQTNNTPLPDNLDIAVNALTNQEGNQLVKQAAIITSGINVEELGALQNGANIAAQAKLSANNTANAASASANAAGRTANPASVSARNAHLASGDGNVVSSVSTQTGTNASQNLPAGINVHVATGQNVNTPQNAIFDLITGEANIIAQLMAADGDIDPQLLNLIEPGSGIGRGATTLPVTAAPLAGQPHPSTESFAAQVQRLAKADGKGEIIIEMDPPELGKVEVELRIGKDKSVHARMIVEKPETYMMLQRDAGILQKAMEEIGLDANADSFTFDMAQNGDTGSPFSDAQGNKPQLDAGYESGKPSEIVETEMSDVIAINPNTGLVSVNIQV